MNLNEIKIGSSPLIDNEETKKANRVLRHVVGPNYKFYFNEMEREYELWEQRGPMFQLIIPIQFAGEKLNRITDREIRFARGFVMRRRAKNDEDYYKHKEYKKWTAPDEYVDWRPQEDESKWKDTSYHPDNYKRVKKNAVIN